MLTNKLLIIKKDDVNIHNEAERDIFRKFTPEKKWEVISSLKENENIISYKILPAECISELESNFSISILRTLQICLNSSSIWWITQFYSKNGFNILTDSLNRFMMNIHTFTDVPAFLGSFTSCFLSIAKTELGLEVNFFTLLRHDLFTIFLIFIIWLR